MASLPCFFPEVAETPSLGQDVLVGSSSRGQRRVDIGWGTMVMEGFPGLRFPVCKMAPDTTSPGLPGGKEEQARRRRNGREGRG